MGNVRYNVGQRCPLSQTVDDCSKLSSKYYVYLLHFQDGLSQLRLRSIISVDDFQQRGKGSSLQSVTVTATQTWEHVLIGRQWEQFIRLSNDSRRLYAAVHDFLFCGIFLVASVMSAASFSMADDAGREC